jgi:ribosomal protein S18 acetylase RimI-like enzyme
VDVSLRSFREGDRDAVLALSRHALLHPEEQVGHPLWSTRDELDSELASWEPAPEETLRVIEEDGNAAAFGGIELEGHATVFGPLVAPSCRGRKLGSRLLEASIQLARERDVEWTIASVGTRNVAGRLLLERRGFRPRDRLDAVYRLLPAEHRPADEPPGGVRVRPGIAGDLDTLYALYVVTFPTMSRSREVWQRWLEHGEVLVAERDGELVSFVHVEPGAQWITHVGVAEEERGGGVGGYLFSRAVEDYWREHPDRELRLTVIPSNMPAIRLYRRLGFAPWLVLQTFELEL